jgi:hypothetical protein
MRFLTYSLLLTALVACRPAVAADAKDNGGVIRLFNGRNLDGFDTFLESKGTNNDPEKVFQVEDGMLHISGAEYGYAVTKDEYENYYLRAEFKWGEATHPPRKDQARDSGILFHVTGPNKIWPTSIEYQMIEGGTGDIILVGNTTTLTVNGVTKTRSRFNRAGKSPTPGKGLYIAGYRDPNMEYENQHGEWNLLELFADGNSIKYVVNGKVANEGTGSNLTRGKILFQSEGAEVYFRNMELRPLPRK